MKRAIVLTAIATAGLALLGTPVLGAPMFFAEANAYPGSSTTLDQSWQAAVGSVMELDLDGYANGADIDTLTFGSIVVDVGLGDITLPGGPTMVTSNTAEIFAGSWGGSSNGSYYGTVSGDALLNRSADNAIHPSFVFDFPTPVAGFGAWVFDNSLSTAESFHMGVVEGGTTFISPVLESGNGTAHFVEGWLGAKSSVGITRAFLFATETGTLNPATRAFEIDHLQLSPVPVPGAALLGLLGLGAATARLRRNRASRS